MENTQNPFTPPQAGPKKSNKLKIIIAVLVLAVIGGAGYFFIQSDSDIFQGKLVKLSNDKGPVKTEKKSKADSAQDVPSKSGINTCQTSVSNNQSCEICYDYNNVEVSRRCEYIGPPIPAPEPEEAQAPEIVITRSSEPLGSGTTIVSGPQQVARFNISARGNRTIFIESVTVVCTGDFVINSEFNDNRMDVWLNGESIFNDMEGSPDCSDTTVGSKGRIADFARPILIAPGATVELIFEYDTFTTAGQYAGESFVFKIDGVAGESPLPDDAVDWSYAGNPEPRTESNSYPVLGPTLRY